MELREHTSQNSWDAFVAQQEHSSFLQSWAWGEFQKMQKNLVFRITLLENEVIIGAAQLVIVVSKRGAYAECIGGPVIAKDYFEHFPTLLEYIHTIARKHSACFLRLRIPYKDSPEINGKLKKFGFKKTYLYYQAETTRIIDLSKKDMLNFFDKKTRYDINRAGREGVVVQKVQGDTPEAEAQNVLCEFLAIYRRMVERQRYIGYSDRYIDQQFYALKNTNTVSVYTAHLQDRVVAAAIFVSYGDTVTYLHAASIPVAKCSPTALVLYKAMHDAQDRGVQYMDLFGVAPPGKRYASREGLTKFKEGFGGELWNWARTRDFVYRPMPYVVSQIIERIPLQIRSKGARILNVLRRNHKNR